MASATPADCARAHGFAAQHRVDTHRSTWAQLLLRVFAIDVLEYPHCGARRKLIALISDGGVVVRKIFDHLGLPQDSRHLAQLATHLRAREATHCLIRSMPTQNASASLESAPENAENSP